MKEKNQCNMFKKILFFYQNDSIKLILIDCDTITSQGLKYRVEKTINFYVLIE